ncbi:hypothetical protein ACFV0T_22805 [Streptomyces sp. NPDC059582]|uniref:hypothetical protein n=1 Tax=Streptomyces sp. NPDC059582 TaxID=3346875 RepID=UPI003687CFD7
MNRIRVAAAAIAVTGTLALTAGSPANAAAHCHHTRPMIVLVHGARAGASRWNAVTTRLQHQGYTVKVAPDTLRGVATDTANLKTYLATI